ncbi:hypothetical protein [Sphingomonas sp. VDB2]|uniref:hypothetical protein n=1 Tax=Sphingomonas sp. VDB2 TaxID=3228751 RepID=UPI003A80AEC7
MGRALIRRDRATNKLPIYAIQDGDPNRSMVIATSRAKAYVHAMFSGTASLAIAGASYPNHRGAERRAEIAQCRPGDPLTFRRLRGPADGKRSVGVYSERGVQVGYVSPDDLAKMPGLVSVGRAVFQSADTWGCVIRASADGSTPALPQPKPSPQIIYPPRPPVDEYCDIFPAGKQGRRTRAADLRHSDKMANRLISNTATKGEPVGKRHDK